jgi:wobble nucleotide-excising tRNase
MGELKRLVEGVNSKVLLEEVYNYFDSLESLDELTYVRDFFLEKNIKDISDTNAQKQEHIQRSGEGKFDRFMQGVGDVARTLGKKTANFGTQKYMQHRMRSDKGMEKMAEVLFKASGGDMTKFKTNLDRMYDIVQKKFPRPNDNKNTGNGVDAVANPEPTSVVPRGV